MNQQTDNPKNITFAQRILNDILESIVKSIQPEQVIFLAPASRGEIDPNDRIPVLVVKDFCDLAVRSEFEAQVYKNLHTNFRPVDAIVVAPRDIERLHSKNLLKGSKVVYDAACEESRSEDDPQTQDDPQT